MGCLWAVSGLFVGCCWAVDGLLTHEKSDGGRGCVVITFDNVPSGPAVKNPNAAHSEEVAGPVLVSS